MVSLAGLLGNNSIGYRHNQRKEGRRHHARRATLFAMQKGLLSV